MGPWAHGQWSERDGSFLGDIKFGTNTAEWYQHNIEIPFFNYYLKEKGNHPELAEATIFFSGENQWRKFDKWPPAESNAKTIYLETNRALSWNKPMDSKKFSEYTSDPSHPVPYMEEVQSDQQKEYMIADQRFASRRQDVLTFQTTVLDKELVLAGPVIADLKVSISSTDADFVVKLIDAFPDDIKDTGDRYQTMNGYQMLVRGEIMRGRYRNSFEKPEAFFPDSIETVRFELPDIAHTFKKGHRLMIQIQSSWFPLADRNPQKFVNIYEADESDFQEALIRIYHDAINSSTIVLPVLK
jgi:putative CocE/NonD family hydrolase